MEIKMSCLPAQRLLFIMQFSLNTTKGLFIVRIFRIIFLLLVRMMFRIIFYVDVESKSTTTFTITTISNDDDKDKWFADISFHTSQMSNCI